MPASIVHAAAEIDVSTAPTLRQEVYAAIEASPGGVVTVDMSGVEFIDSTGLGVLVGALKKARLGNGDVALAGLQPQVLKIFTITGLHKVFTASAPG